MDKDKDTYISKYLKIEKKNNCFNLNVFLAAFDPSGTSEDAHHMLLYGCTEPGSEKKIW